MQEHRSRPTVAVRGTLGSSSAVSARICLHRRPDRRPAGVPLLPARRLLHRSVAAGLARRHRPCPFRPRPLRPRALPVRGAWPQADERAYVVGGGRVWQWTLRVRTACSPRRSQRYRPCGRPTPDSSDRPQSRRSRCPRPSGASARACAPFPGRHRCPGPRWSSRS